MPVPLSKTTKEGKDYAKWEGIVKDFNSKDENKAYKFDFAQEWAKAKDLPEFIRRFKEREKKATEGPTLKESTKEEIPENSFINFQSPSKSTTPLVSNNNTTSSNPTVKKEKKEKKKKQASTLDASLIFSGATTTQQTVRVVQPTTNTLIQQWIQNRPQGASIVEGDIVVSADTVYLYADVEIPNYTQPYPQVDIYHIETHYHPVPTSNNFLHVKHSAASDAGNVVGPNCWLIPRGTASLRDAVVAWNHAYPENQSTHTW
jgi:hypothetical protein